MYEVRNPAQGSALFTPFQRSCFQNYFPEMGRLDIPQPLRCKGNVIFGNLEKIADFHSHYFLRDLEECQGDPMLVAKTFQKHVSVT